MDILFDSYSEIVQTTPGTDEVKKRFRDRMAKGQYSRDENPASHFCTYFPAYDPIEKMVFLGLHKKSGLWLFNGGHVDKGERPTEAVSREMREEWGISFMAPSPSLLTITDIENPKKQICEIHYDIWYFISVDSSSFAPSSRLLAAEFVEWGWKTTTQASSLIRNKETHHAISVFGGLFQ